jgi:hypothetical protein
MFINSEYIDTFGNKICKIVIVDDNNNYVYATYNYFNNISEISSNFISDFNYKNVMIGNETDSKIFNDIKTIFLKKEMDNNLYSVFRKCLSKFLLIKNTHDIFVRYVREQIINVSDYRIMDDYSLKIMDDNQFTFDYTFIEEMFVNKNIYILKNNITHNIIMVDSDKVNLIEKELDF